MYRVSYNLTSPNAETSENADSEFASSNESAETAASPSTHVSSQEHSGAVTTETAPSPSTHVSSQSGDDGHGGPPAPVTAASPTLPPGDPITATKTPKARKKAPAKKPAEEHSGAVTTAHFNYKYKVAI
jgi:hypothetical protein